MPKKVSAGEEKALVELSDNLVHPEQLKAMNVFINKQIPEDAIKTRPGGDGKMYDYISHIWVTEQMQRAFGNAVDFEVLDWEVFQDQPFKKGAETKMTISVAARVKLTIRIIIDPELRKFPTDPMYFERVVIETGVFHKQGIKMPIAMAVASAVSRGLCRCVMRMFGVGIHLYKNEEEMTFVQMWQTLKDFAENQQPGIWTKEFETAFADHLKTKGVTKDNMADKFAIAYELINAVIKGEIKLEE
jgi:hypothetical protein